MSSSLDCCRRKKPSTNCQTLLDNLIREIFYRLPASSIVRFRYLNKYCNSLTRSKQFIKLQLHRTVENINETRRWRVLMSICRNPAWSIRVESLDNFGSQVGHVVVKSVSKEALLHIKFSYCIPMAWVIGSCNGLLCINMHEEPTLLVWNPCTSVREYVSLPSNGRCYPLISSRTILGFGNDGSATDGLKIVMLNTYISSGDNNHAHQSTVDIRIFTLGGSDWRQKEEKVPHIMNLFGRGLYFKGALHWVNGLETVMPTGIKRGIIVFSLGKEKFEQVMPLPEYDDDMKLKRFQIRVMCGKLTAFYCSPYWSCSSGFDIWVMERYGVKESWTKKISIANLNYSAFVQRISFLRDDSLLLNIDNEKVIVYDPKNRTYNTIESLSLPLPSYKTSIIEYVESLVPPICDADVK